MTKTDRLLEQHGWVETTDGLWVCDWHHEAVPKREAVRLTRRVEREARY